MTRPWGSEPAECKRVDAFLESYVDDELTRVERREVDLHLEACRACREELELAASVAMELRSLSLLARPSAEHGVPPAMATPAPADLSTPSRRPLWNHPLLQAAAVLLLLSGVWLAISDAPFAGRPGSGSRLSNGELDQYSESELRAAEEDLRLALSYFGGLAEKAGLVVRDDVLGERVVAPTRRAFRRIGDLGTDVDSFASDSFSASDVEKNP